MLFRVLLCLATALCLQLTAAPAHADVDGEAKQAFERGVSASNEQRWQVARDEFQRSLDRVVKPSTLFNLAVANLKLGLAQEALDALDRFAELASPQQHATMIERATTMRAEAERNLEAERPAFERARGLIEPSNLGREARESFSAGRDAYARGDDQSALDAFTRAHRESARDELLFDIGVAADRLRADQRAIDAFERFVSAFPTLPEAEQARRHLERLQQVIAEKSRAQPSSTIASGRDDSAPQTSEPALHMAPVSLAAPRGLLAAGAVLAAGALGSAGLWIERSGAREDRCLATRSRCSNFDLVQRQKRAAIGLTVSLSVAAVALLTGGGVWLHKRKRGVALTDASAWLAPHGLVTKAVFSF